MFACWWSFLRFEESVRWVMASGLGVSLRGCCYVEGSVLRGVAVGRCQIVQENGFCEESVFSKVYKKGEGKVPIERR